MFIEILFKILLFKGGVLIYAEHCISDKQNTTSDIKKENLSAVNGQMTSSFAALANRAAVHCIFKVDL